MGLLVRLTDYLDALVHPSARQDPLLAARHRAFMAPRLLAGLIALAVFPVYCTIRGVPNLLEIVTIGWFVTPIVIAQFLSRTGQLERAQFFSSLALTALVTILAFETGGLSSIAIVWFTLVLYEATLSASRRVLLAASALVIGCVALLCAFDAAAWLPQPILAGPSTILTGLAIGSAMLYASLIAFGAQMLERTGAQLRDVEETRYRLLAHNMTDVLTCHSRNGVVEFVSPAAEALFGVAPHALRGHGLFDRVHIADRPAYLMALADATSQRVSRSIEIRIRRDQVSSAAAASPFIWVEMRCRPLDRQIPGAVQGRDYLVLAVLRDITERKAQEQVLEDARLETERANAAKSGFLATMSHELRTPLNAIIGFSEMLMNEDLMNLGQAGRQDYARIIKDSGAHLLSLVDGVLDMSKIEAGHFQIEPESFALPAVIASCCDLMALRAREAGLELAIDTADQLPALYADKRAVKQIVLNLLSNAIKFTPSGGHVTITATAQGESLILSVADTGIGVAKADIARLGTPFFQVRESYDRPHEGAGLGLSIIKGLVALHGGEMDVASRLGEGTCVTVRLPIHVAHRDGASATIEDLSVIRNAAKAKPVEARKRA